MGMLDRGKDITEVLDRMLRSKRTNHRRAAIDLVIDIFGLNTPATDGYAGLEINYNPSLKGDGEQDIKNGIIIIDIGSDAFDNFPGSAGWLASVIDHEFCHVKQATGASCFTSPKSPHTTGYRWFSEMSEGYQMNEVEAQAYSLAHAHNYRLTSAEIQERYNRYNFWFDLLVDSNQERARLRWFMPVSGTENWP